MIRPRRRKTLMACGAVILLGIWVAWASHGLGVYYWLYTFTWGNEAFDREAWLEAEPQPDSVRGQMVRSLLRDIGVVGRTREEVLGLLGAPELLNWYQVGGSRSPEDERALASAEDYCYILGYRSGFGIDEDYLIVEFDSTGRVRRWGIGY